MSTHEKREDDINFHSLFAPFTTIKAIIFLSLIGFIVYLNALFNGFVWDDFVFIVNNQEVHTVNFEKLFSENRFNNASYYRPIPALYFALVYSLSNAQPFLYHFFQITLHIVVTILLFFLYKKFFKQTIAFFLAALFLVHPINVESVAYIGATQSQLFTITGLTALYLIINKKITLPKYFYSGILMILSLLTKEVGLLFGFMALVWCFIYEKSRILVLFAIEIIILVVYGILRFNLSVSSIEKVSLAPIAQLSLTERLINIPLILNYYLKTIFFPLNLAIDQHWIVKNISINNFYIPLIFDLLFLLILLLLAIYFYRKLRHSFYVYLFFAFWFMSGLAFVSQLYPLDMTVAERWMYFPLMGLLGMIGVSVENYNKKLNKSVIIHCSIILIIILSIRTIVRNSNWQDAITLYSHDISIENNFDMNNNLSTEYFIRGDLQKSLYYVNQSVLQFPYEINLKNLGINYLYDGKIMLAINAFERAYKAKHYSDIPKRHFAGTYKLLAWTYLYTKDNRAKNIILDGLKEYPLDADLWYELALFELEIEDYESAKKSVEKSQSLGLDSSRYNYLRKSIAHKQKVQLGSNNVWIDVH